MRGHVIAEDHFLHLGIDHHVVVTKSDDVENEYRFEVRCIPPGSDQQETEFEKTIDYSNHLSRSVDTDIEQLIRAELQVIKTAVINEDNIHAHDP